MDWSEPLRVLFLPRSVVPRLFPGRQLGVRLDRAGIGLVEIMVTLAVIAIVSAMVIPDLVVSTDAKSVHGAANVVESELATARTAAITRGRCAVIHLSSNMLWVTTANCGSTGTAIDTVIMQDLSAAYGVTAEACWGSCWFGTGSTLTYRLDPRGIPVSATSATFVVSKNAAADTVLVGPFGRVTR